MNGAHDLGGTQGHGPIAPPAEEPVFAHEWERRVFGLFVPLFGAGCYNIDEFRHGIERMRPSHYLDSTYYEHWLCSYEKILIEKGYITEAELDARIAQLKGAN